MTKFTSRSTKKDLVSYLVEHGHDAASLKKLTKATLLAKATEARENAKLKKKADGKRTSLPGATAHFRATFAAPGARVERKALIAEFVERFGPKSKWNVLNLVGKAKKGKLVGVAQLEEEDGVLVVPGGKTKKRTKKKASRKATKKKGSK